jgi:DnaJ-class molecular chaperone
MAIDYYKVLNISRQASVEEIKKMYRQLALKYHPDRNSNPGASIKFNEITEAYVVLSNEISREEFDRNGTNYTSNSTFSFSAINKDLAQKIFTQAFVTTSNRKSDLIDDLIDLGMKVGKRRASTGDTAFKPSLPSKRQRIQDPSIYKDLRVTLEEIKSGCTKKMKITKTVLNPDHITSRKVEKILKIDVKPGSKEGTTITFPKEGDEKRGVIPADIVFVLKDNPHELYQRDLDNNLIYTIKINLRRALIGDTTYEIPTLSGDRKLHFNSGGRVIKPKFTKTFPGEGLPHPEQDGKCGNLLLTFDIIFPDQFNSEQKDLLKTVLS